MCRLFVLGSHTRTNSSILWCCCCRCRCCLLSHSFSTENPIVGLAVGVFLSLFGFVFIYLFFWFRFISSPNVPLWLCLYVHKLWYDNHYFKSSPINMKNIVIYLSTNAHIHAHTNNVLLVPLSFRQSLVYRVLAKWFGAKPICTMTILKTISCAYQNNLSFIHAHIIMDFSRFFFSIYFFFVTEIGISNIVRDAS